MLQDRARLWTDGKLSASRKFGRPSLLSRLAGVALLGLACLSLARGQQVHRNPFEGREISWQKGPADAPFRETLHDMTDLTAHTGQNSEHIQLQAEAGNYIYYRYPTSRAPMSDDLQLSVWVKANRPGIQLVSRLVLPKEHSATSLQDNLTTLLRGDQYQNVGRWERLELRRPVKLAREQQHLMRAEMHRDVDFTDAYIDCLLLNVYSGPGLTDVWIDDLEIGPVLDPSPFQTTSRPAGSGLPGQVSPVPAVSSRTSAVELKQDHLCINGKQFFMRAIRHSDAPLPVLRDAGFNTLCFDWSSPPADLLEAVKFGFWLIPSLPTPTGNSQPPAGIEHEIVRFGATDAVLFWNLGAALVNEQHDAVVRAAEQIHAVDPQHPTGADIWDGFRPYSRTLDMIGVHRWPLMTMLELSQYREWLEQRRLLMRPGSYMWTWIQTHLPEWYTSLVYQKAANSSFEEPIGPQPEQIRLLTYVAIAAGCRGLGFWSDQFLADSHQGRDRLLALALLNLELQMLDPLLVSADAPRWIDTSEKEVKAAVMPTAYGTLVMPMWLGKGAQYVPGQSAAAKLTMVVPEVPVCTQAWLISPADVHSLQSERIVGGMKVIVPEFGLTGAVLFTADNNPNGIIVRLQEQLRRTRKMGAQWSHDLAELEFAKVTQVQGQLQAARHVIPDGQQLLTDARTRLRNSVEYWNNGDYREAYHEAERSMRPLRILMRAQWEEASKSLDTPVASPYAVSYFTLPRHWRLATMLQQGNWGGNVLPNGGFETSVQQGPAGWVVEDARLDDVVANARQVTQSPQEGRMCLQLEVKPRDAAASPKALERTFLAVNSPAVRLQPGTWVRISGWIKIPTPITASVDGALLYDSAGGEPLALRLTESTRWKKFTLYRQVPPSGTISVTLALTGIGAVYFDDVRIEPLLGKVAAPS